MAELKKEWKAVEKAKPVGARTQRERDYIAAIEIFYKDSERLDHRTRALAYGDAMERLYRSYPSDGDAGVFHALTLIAKGMMAGDKSYINEKKAAQILNRVQAREPQHPGVAHYLIHSYDYPALAHLALPAARSYAKIAPASAHARHMPSHNFHSDGSVAGGDTFKPRRRSGGEGLRRQKPYARGVGQAALRDGLSGLCLPARRAG